MASRTARSAKWPATNPAPFDAARKACVDRSARELALARNAIVKRNAEGKLSGTGPFHIVDWQPGRKLTLAAEERFPDACLRLRYEDLVADPEAVAAAVFKFLEVPLVPGISQACFSADRERFGPGDHKIWYTSAISAEARSCISVIGTKCWAAASIAAIRSADRSRNVTRPAAQPSKLPLNDPP